MSGPILYTYVWNNPTNDTDPTGFSKISDQMHDSEGWSYCASCATSAGLANGFAGLANGSYDLSFDAKGNLIATPVTGSSAPSGDFSCHAEIPAQGGASAGGSSAVAPTLTMGNVATYQVARAKAAGSSFASFFTDDIPNAAGSVWDFAHHPIDSVSNWHPIDGLESGGLAMQDWARNYFMSARSGDWAKAGAMEGQYDGKAAANLALGAGAGKVIDSIVLANTALSATEIRAIVRETATPYGKSGQAYNVGSTSELISLFKKITVGSENVSAKYDGTMRIARDGTRIGLRNESKTGGQAIDVFPQSGKPYKVHIGSE